MGDNDHMNQLTFGDAEYLGKRKRTRREIFLEEMEQVIPKKEAWPEFPQGLALRADWR